MELADAAGFMFDLDGTLVERSPEGVVALPGAAEVLAAIRASGRPLVVFTNASHADPATIAAGVR
ncbi:MAG: haloacid dehalogenase, partial [Solirubrobacteraceae bacterium]